jgi:hypothetical protein
MWDTDLLVSRKRGFQSRTQWVFASIRRVRPKNNDGYLPDPSIYPNTLDAHLRALRGQKESGSNKVDYLKDMPHVWLHGVRSAMTNYFDEHRGTLPPGVISAILGHTLPDDSELDWLRISKTTEKYYLTYQHMDLKARAMKEWSEALLRAYVKAGGTPPMPCEKDPSKPKGPDWILPRLPGEEPSPSRRRTGDFSRRGSQRSEQAPRERHAPACRGVVAARRRNSLLHWSDVLPIGLSLKTTTRVLSQNRGLFSALRFPGRFGSQGPLLDRPSELLVHHSSGVTILRRLVEQPREPETFQDPFDALLTDHRGQH